MSPRVRQPVVGGIAGGVGTTTIADLIEAIDDGIVIDAGQVDILVARSTASSVKAAIEAAAAMTVAPVLVVVAHSHDRCPPPAEQRLKMAEPNLAGLVRLDWISYLAGCDDPWSQLTTAMFADIPPKWVRQASRAREQLLASVTDLVRVPAPAPTPRPTVRAADDADRSPPQARVS